MSAKVNRVQTAPHNRIRIKLQPQKSIFSPYHNTIWGGTLQPIVGLTLTVLTTTICLAPGAIAQTTNPQTRSDSRMAQESQRLDLVTPESGSEETPDVTQPSPVAVPELTPRTPNRTQIPPAQVPETLSEDTYLLGPGDQIGIDIFDVPEFSGANGRYVVLVDGSINLPWVGRVLVQGLTLEQAADVLTQAYAPFIRDPLVNVSLTTARTLRVSVVGEVKRPGSYIISPEGETNQILVGDAAIGGGGAPSQWPTVTQALQTAGGITQMANLRQIQIRRPMPNGAEQLISVNLWELLRTGQLNQDLTLRDKDVLIVPKAETLTSDEALLNGSASFAPETIRINVVGEVGAPGIVEVPPNTSLNQALLAAGGFDRRRARSSRVNLVRLNTDGTAVKRTVEIDLAAGINEENNPSLRDGDTIIVGRSNVTQFRDFLDDVFGPLDAVFGRILDIF
jgi:polysaccharide biosynthesis/export protein